VTRCHAVIVGVDRYVDPAIPALRFACDDARSLAALLSESISAADVTVHTLLDRDATRGNVLRLIGVDVARQAQPDDIVLFYFAGHGSPEVYPGLDTLSRFLVCADTERDSLLSGAIDIQADLSRLTARLQARLVLFVIDACFSGYGGGRGICGPVIAEHRRLHRPAARLADLTLGSGVAYLAACADDEVAGEDVTLGHGVFTYYLLRHLTEVGVSPTIGLATLYDLIFQQVHDYSTGRQNPVLWGTVKGAGLPRLGHTQ